MLAEKKLKSLTTLYASLVCSGKSLHIFAIIGARKFHSVKNKIYLKHSVEK